MKWWRRFLTIDTIAILIIVVAVLYCFFTSKRRKKYKFTAFDHASNLLSNAEASSRRKRRTKKKKINKHEERCREIFQSIFKQPFKSVRPNWLKNPATGKNLELDGFCPYIQTPMGRGLAYEYDGQQHAKYTPHFHRNGPQEFIYQVKKDSWKDMKCKQNGVLLIRIPHFVPFHDLERYIKLQLKNKGLGHHIQSYEFRGAENISAGASEFLGNLSKTLGYSVGAEDSVSLRP